MKCLEMCQDVHTRLFCGALCLLSRVAEWGFVNQKRVLASSGGGDWRVAAARRGAGGDTAGTAGATGWTAAAVDAPGCRRHRLSPAASRSSSRRV